MPGPPPKNPELRQRTNKSSTVASLTPHDQPVPGLPNHRIWHPMTQDWWRDIWSSPMGAQFLEADRHALYRLAILIDAFWLEPSKELASEIRQQEARFGLTPLDRWRLQWKVEAAPAAVKAPVEVPTDDPRVVAIRKKA